MTDAGSGPGDDLGVVIGEAVALDVRPTGFALRAAGAAIDVVAVVLLTLGLLIGALLLGTRLGADAELARPIVVVVLVLGLIVAPAVVEIATRGRSLGKLAVGARIVRLDGGAISARHAFIRSVVGAFELVVTLGGIAAIVGLLNRRAQRLGDLLAGTVSQLERVPRRAVTALPVPPELAGWAATADVARLPDPVARRIAAFLAQAHGMMPASRAALAADLLAEAAPSVQPVPPGPADRALQAITAVRRQREQRAFVLEQERAARLEPVRAANPNGFPER